MADYDIPPSFNQTRYTFYFDVGSIAGAYSTVTLANLTLTSETSIAVLSAVNLSTSFVVFDFDDSMIELRGSLLDLIKRINWPVTGFLQVADGRDKCVLLSGNVTGPCVSTVPFSLYATQFSPRCPASAIQFTTAASGPVTWIPPQLNLLSIGLLELDATAEPGDIFDQGTTEVFYRPYVNPDPSQIPETFPHCRLEVRVIL